MYKNDRDTRKKYQRTVIANIRQNTCMRTFQMTSRQLEKYLTDQHLQYSAGLCNVGEHVFKVLCKEFLCMRHVLEFYDKRTINIRHARLEISRNAA